MRWFFVTSAFACLLNFETGSRAQTTVPCSAAEYRQFDFWVGDWQVFDYAGGKKGDLAGTNKVIKILANCVIQENWSGSQGGIGTSLNTYDLLERNWHQTYVDDQGTFLHLSGAGTAGTMEMTGKHPGPRVGVTVTERISWSVVAGNPDQVRQFWQQSRDDGQTWTVAFDGLYIRK